VVSILLVGIVEGGYTTLDNSAWATSFPGANGKIVFESDRDNGIHEIYVMNADGAFQTRLTISDDDDGDPCWSADGSMIAWDRQNGDRDVFVMNADGSNQVNKGPFDADDGDPCWSPDGSKIVFESEEDGRHDIWVMNADGSNPINLSDNPTGSDRNPSWSPDGSKIAFESNRDGNREIYVMDADGSDQTNLTDDPARDELPNWSPDGSQIAFLRILVGTSNAEIFVMDSDDGLGQTNLTDDPANDEDPSWSPAGNKIAFASDRDGDFEIFVMDSDGDNQQELTDNDFLDVRPDWQPVHPECGDMYGSGGRDFGDEGTIFLVSQTDGSQAFLGDATAGSDGVSGIAFDDQARLWGSTVSGGGNPSNLIEINPSDGSLINDVGPILDAFGDDMKVQDLAFDPVSRQLFGTEDNTSDLIIIDRTTGMATSVGSLPTDKMHIGFAPDGTLWAVDKDSNKELFTLDPTNGIDLTDVARSSEISLDALGVDPATGIIWVSEGSDESIYTLATDGTLTFVGEPRGDSVADLAFLPCPPKQQPVVGGEFLPIDSTALLLAGLQSSAIWMLPVLAVAAGAGFAAFKLRRK